MALSTKLIFKSAHLFGCILCVKWAYVSNAHATFQNNEYRSFGVSNNKYIILVHPTSAYIQPGLGLVA